MIRLIIGSVFIAFLSASPAHAADTSPAKDLYAQKVSHAAQILDGYRGSSESLEEARGELEAVLKARPRNAPAYREMARYFIMSGHLGSRRFQPGSLEAADAAIKQALAIKPNYAEAYILRGHLYRLMNRPQDALAALKTAEKMGSNDPWLQSNWADLLNDEGKYEQAARRYQRIIDSNTPNKKAMQSAFEGLVNYYERIEDLVKAEETYMRRLKFAPDDAWAYGNYAQFLFCRKDDYENSIIRARQALGIMDYGLGRYWLAAGLYRKWAQYVLDFNDAEGQKYFEEARTIFPDPEEVADTAGNCPPLVKIFFAVARVKHNASLGNRVVK